MELGQKVIFNRYYRKSGNYVAIGHLMAEQENELEETEQIILHRTETITLPKPLTGIICGKRKMPYTSVLAYAPNRYNPEADDQFGVISSTSIDVYLVATRMDRMYRVPAEWLEDTQ